MLWRVIVLCGLLICAPGGFIYEAEARETGAVYATRDIPYPSPTPAAFSAPQRSSTPPANYTPSDNTQRVSDAARSTSKPEPAGIPPAAQAFYQPLPTPNTGGYTAPKSENSTRDNDAPPIEVAAVGTGITPLLIPLVFGDITTKDADTAAIATLNNGQNKEEGFGKVIYMYNNADKYKNSGAVTIRTEGGEFVVNPEAFNATPIQGKYNYYFGNISLPDQTPDSTGSLNSILLALPLYAGNATAIAGIKNIVQPLFDAKMDGTAGLIVQAGNQHVYLTAEHVIHNMKVGDIITLGVRTPDLVREAVDSYLKGVPLSEGPSPVMAARETYFKLLQQYNFEGLHQKARIERIERDAQHDIGILFLRFTGDKVPAAHLGERIQVTPIRGVNPASGDLLEFYERPIWKSPHLRAHYEVWGGNTYELRVTREFTTGRGDLNKSFFGTEHQVVQGWSGSPVGVRANDRLYIGGIASHGEGIKGGEFFGLPKSFDSSFVKPFEIRAFIEKILSEKTSSGSK